MSSTTTAASWKSISEKLLEFTDLKQLEDRNRWFNSKFAGAPCILDHPEFGWLPGTILGGEFLGFLERGKIPEYSVTVRGASSGKIDTFLLVQHGIQRMATMRQAITETKKRRC